MYAVPDPEKCIFNGLKESKDTGRSRTAFLGKLGKLSELEALCGLSFDVIVLDLCSTSEALSEKLPEYLPEHKIVFMRRYTARQFGCPASDSGCIFGLTKRPPTEKGLEALRRLMSVQLEQCIDLESYHTSDVQWHYFGDAPTACGTEASSDPAAAQPPPAVQGTTDADEPGDEMPEQKKKLTLPDLIAKAVEHNWLPHEGDVKKKQLAEVEKLPCKRKHEDLVQVHAAILRQYAKQRRLTSIVMSDASSQRLSHHQVYSGELPPFGKPMMCLSYHPTARKDRFRIVSNHELLQARGYPLGTVHVQLLGMKAAGQAAAGAPPSALGLILCAAARLLQPDPS
ncbi:unnamed protein product [Symbiodinium necroappetens]|uniref:Uncharacterized protein n=1 Tax=Symbiodinium necroappetens TaxID=1628268 RepID=A0A812V5S9_9DINO|nr:unnamed protein product [Symbiodinium necroappetens]